MFAYTMHMQPKGRMIWILLFCGHTCIICFCENSGSPTAPRRTRAIQQGMGSLDLEWWSQASITQITCESGSPWNEAHQQGASFCASDTGELHPILRERPSGPSEGRETNSKPQTNWTEKRMVTLHTHITKFLPSAWKALAGVECNI